MTQELFDIYLTGRLLSGHNRKEVIVNLAQLTDRSVPDATALLDNATCVQAGVGQAAAEEYREILEETGAEAVVRACVGFSTPVETADGAVAEPADPQPATPQPVAAAAPDPAREFVAEETPVLDEAVPDPVAAPVATAAPGPFAGLVDLEVPAASAPVVPQPRRRFLTRRLLVILVLVVLLATLAAAGISYGLRARAPGAQLAVVGEVLNLAQPFQQQVEQVWRQRGAAPASLSDLNLRAPAPLADLATLIPDRDGRLILQFTAAAGSIAGSTLELVPRQGDAGVEWQCGGGSLAAAERPPECQDSSILQ